MFGTPMMMESAVFERRAERYLTDVLGTSSDTVSGASLILGGASRETWSVDARWNRPDRGTESRRLIFRLDPPSSLLESHRTIEFAMYNAMYRVPNVPVPEPLFIEDDESYLGMPFFVMERMEGVAAPADLLLTTFDDSRKQIVTQAFGTLGTIARADHHLLGLDDVFHVPTNSDAWEVELRRWEKILHRHDLGPLPVTRAVIRELRRNPPPPAPRVVVVHGDFRIGNFLFVPGRCVAILDWEMSHLGDPHEDLAWAFLPNWRHRSAPGKIGSCLDPEEAMAIWESTSGMNVDRDALRWWTLLGHVKALAIWVTGADEFASQRTKALEYATMEWALGGAQEKWMIEEMGVLAR
jgi:aminoglycoside phosphotransferase (APT) family kinase protein